MEILKWKKAQRIFFSVKDFVSGGNFMEIYSSKEKINLADDEMARKMGKVVEMFLNTY